MEKILLSIIIPMYNVEKYINKCLDTILPQLTGETELILVDDCTPDCSGQIAQERLQGITANAVYFCREQNGGLSAARNSGLELAKGKYCWFVDSDDYISADAVQVILNNIRRQDTDLLIFNYTPVNEEGVTDAPSVLGESAYSFHTPQERLTQMCLYLKGLDTGYCVWRRVYSMDIIRQHGLRFEPNKEVFAEDMCFNLYYLNYCSRVRTIRPALYYYLLRGDSIMGQNQERPRLQQMHNLAKKVFDHTPFGLVKENFSLIYAGVQAVHYGLAQWQDMAQHAKNIQEDAFALEMSRQTVKELSRHMAYHGKRNSIYQYLYAQTLWKLLQGKKTGARCYFALVSFMRKWNV